VNIVTHCDNAILLRLRTAVMKGLEKILDKLG